MGQQNRLQRVHRWTVGIGFAVQACIPSIAAQNGGNCAIDPRCPRFDTGDSAVLVPHPDCGKFYKCALGKACEYNCPANLHFNPILLTCDYPHVACCSRDVACTGPTTQGSNQPSGGSGMYPPIGDITSARPGCVVDSRCSSSEALNSEKPLVLKHSSCEKFYMCSGGEACEVDCPPGLHFNAQQSRCDYQDAACCDTSIPCARNNLEVPMSSCIPDVRCSLYENPFDPTHLPHPTNCNRFYKCSYGKACELPCPQGQHFSVAMNRCEFPEVACCDKSIRCSGPYAVSDLYPETRDEPIKPAEPVEPREEPTKAPNAPTPESIRINTCFEAQQCPDGDGRMNQLMRHNDCTKFFSCFQGTICEFVCPIGLHFNERSKVCDKPEIAQCSQGFN
ncbi:conserved hypothetical protein [Culex quinquefasciatus]|uniref:Chitin-binding type-2 domain-containing protein n=1 Tax=Culex quinquefasciatus TaxID=7176 RepID=B0WLF9_CULQU|nr:conserved hypothetical protein [Culex quinquefasciatus]|eukprot:XP_001849543.1 conserved hypothetical protein [Culex quinquefasciatus]